MRVLDDLKRRLARLEKKHGADNPFVKDVRAQIASHSQTPPEPRLIGSIRSPRQTGGYDSDPLAASGPPSILEAPISNRAYTDARVELEAAIAMLRAATNERRLLTSDQVEALRGTLQAARSEIAVLDHTSNALQDMIRHISEAARTDRQVRDDLQRRNSELVVEMRDLKARLGQLATSEK